MIKVAKFGGSSVANAEQFNKVKNIVLSDPARQFVVTSACGKESREDHKVTERERDTMEQERIAIEDLPAYFAEKMRF